MRLRGVGGVRAVRAGMGGVGEKLGGTERNSEGLRFREREGGNLVVMEVWELCGRIGN